MTGETWHGTAGGYRNRDCRCDACKAANGALQMQLRRNRNQKRLDGFTGFAHGATGYQEWGCRCGECKAAKAAQQRTYYAKRAAHLARSTP